MGQRVDVQVGNGPITVEPGIADTNGILELGALCVSIVSVEEHVRGSEARCEWAVE